MAPPQIEAGHAPTRRQELAQIRRPEAIGNLPEQNQSLQQDVKVTLRRW